MTFKARSFTLAKENWNDSDKVWNGLEHGPQNIEERVKPLTRCVFDTGIDRAGEKNETDQYRKEGERLHVRK